MKENEASERAEWEKQCRDRLDDEWREKESKLAGKFKFERDEELDKVVEKLEAEISKEKVELQKELEDKIRFVLTFVRHENCESLDFFRIAVVFVPSTTLRCESPRARFNR